MAIALWYRLTSPPVWVDSIVPDERAARDPQRVGDLLRRQTQQLAGHRGDAERADHALVVEPELDRGPRQHPADAIKHLVADHHRQQQVPPAPAAVLAEGQRYGTLSAPEWAPPLKPESSSLHQRA